jgi:ATP-dependent protease HslVU (ClpYQ) peptidase subunit
MTCIVGLEHGGHVFIGGDIQGTGWNKKVVHTQPKVFSKAGVVFGYTTSYRFGQLIEQVLSDPVIPDDSGAVYRWLITVLVPDIKKMLKANEWEEGGSCLIGVKGQLWELQSDWSVLRSVNGYSSVGSGYEYAHGSLYTSLLDRTIKTDDEAISIVQNAIRAAGSFSPSVGCESVVIRTP